MNVYAAVILAALLAEWGLGVLADALNLRSLRDAPPDEFADVVDADEYARVQDYTRARTRLGIAAGTFHLGVLLAFWFAGGFAVLDGWSRSWGARLTGAAAHFGSVAGGPLESVTGGHVDGVASGHLEAVVAGLLFIGALLLARTLLGLPWSIYSTFVVEERFDFNRTTPRTFALDRLKGLGLALAIGAPLLAAVLWFFSATGPWAWAWAWLAVTAVGLALQYVGPRWILPLFNELQPVEDEELREAISSYARSVDFPFGEILVMDASRRSRKSNALFTGFGSNRRVILFDTLVEQHDVAEIVAIVAHEVGHYRRRHIPIGMGLAALHTALLFLLLSVFLEVEGLYEAFYVAQPSVHAGLVFFLLLFTPAELALSLPLNALSRRFEYQADRYAATTAGEPESLVDALKRLAVDNLSNLTPHRLKVVLEYSHPPVIERVRALRATG